MDAQWTVTLLIGLLTALNALALVALTRQVGLLHIRIRPVPALETEDGPQPGDQLSFLTAPWQLPDLPAAVERFVLGFVSPTCNLCRPLLAGFQSIARAQTAEEATILVTEVDPDRAQEYFQGHGISLPYVAERNVLQANRIPGSPFVVVTDSTGKVLSAGAVNSLEQVEFLIDQARTDGAGPDERDALRPVEFTTVQGRR